MCCSPPGSIGKRLRSCASFPPYPHVIMDTFSSIIVTHILMIMMTGIVETMMAIVIIVTTMMIMIYNHNDNDNDNANDNNDNDGNNDSDNIDDHMIIYYTSFYMFTDLHLDMY